MTKDKGEKANPKRRNQPNPNVNQKSAAVGGEEILCCFCGTVYQPDAGSSCEDIHKVIKTCKGIKWFCEGCQRFKSLYRFLGDKFNALDIRLSSLEPVVNDLRFSEDLNQISSVIQTTALAKKGKEVNKDNAMSVSGSQPLHEFPNLPVDGIDDQSMNVTMRKKKHSFGKIINILSCLKNDLSVPEPCTSDKPKKFKSRKKSPLKIIGNKINEGCRLQANEYLVKKKVFLMSNLKACNRSDIMDFLSTNGIKVITCYPVLVGKDKSVDKASNKDDDDASSFRVCVEAINSNKMTDPDIMPKDILVREWVFKQNKRAIDNETKNGDL
ncbi:hypothetical protein HELRODRAFT_164928 [Helobdella robusta]|uniref:Uncharacterized protein n=1 Tax=Helobdella robusta TaxID=6412 RepID=T1EVZ4_HELRO|nr:hypothetical protein HELRODRAFT_164928 [Helobdella robusta]ESN92809.1 hypothetical protein HELRODRAFT_164928 [Helobdella robusta]